MNKNTSVFNSIYGFDQSFLIINDQLLNNIFNCNKQINSSSDIYIDHLLYLKSIKNFTAIKYYEDRRSKNSTDTDEIIKTKNNHIQMQIAVLKKIPTSLSNELEKTKIDLFLSWNKGITKKTFPHNELNNYIKKVREYSSIIGSVFHGKNHYENLIKYNHPKFSLDFTDNLFTKIAPKLKELYKSSFELSKKIKIPKFDLSMIKEDQYDGILKYIIGNFSMNNEKNINDVSKDCALFFDETFSLKKYTQDFTTFLMNHLASILQKKLSSIYVNNSDINNYNEKFLSLTISYFFSFYLLRSKIFLTHLLDFIKKTSVQKSKIFSDENFFLIFNKLSNPESIKSCDEISQMFYSMIQYITERDLVCDKISAEDVPEVWANGIKHYFDIDIKPDHILQNFNFALGKLGNCVFQSHALVNSAMIFDQYSNKTKNDEKYNKNHIKKFLSDINSENMDYITTAMINQTVDNASDLYLKYISERFSSQ